MNTHVRAHIELYEPGEGWTHFRTLPLDDAQRLVLVLTRRLSAQAQPKDIALMTGAELWSMQDDKLRVILEGEWCCVAYFALNALITELYTAIEVRFDEQFSISVVAHVLTYKGHDGEAFRHLPRRGRIDFLDRLSRALTTGNPSTQNQTLMDK